MFYETSFFLTVHSPINYITVFLLFCHRSLNVFMHFFFKAEEQDVLLAGCSTNTTTSNSAGGTRQRMAPTCSKCGKPMRGHHRDRNVLICPSDAE